MEAALICQVHLPSTTLQPGTIVQYTEHGKGSVKLTDYSDVVLPRTLLGLSAAYSSPMNIDSNAQLANARAVLSHGWPAIVNRAVVDGARLHAAMGRSLALVKSDLVEQAARIRQTTAFRDYLADTPDAAPILRVGITVPDTAESENVWMACQVGGSQPGDIGLSRDCDMSCWLDTATMTLWRWHVGGTWEEMQTYAQLTNLP